MSLAQALRTWRGSGSDPGAWDLRSGRDERQVDLALGGTGELDLGFFSRLGQALQRLLVLAQVDAFIDLKVSAR